ncbi:hypothetical protein BGZ70_002905 [Mortierella alpina]|uniref:Fatty acid hydroxylase domain-containing protein n=1 Tax=Mortierella alpina TaxID=64518 RepID=A0A9P6LVP4_MORAP|nr:hypothetical protein BGZ70_002905 [Mortierella alpina]
MALIAQAPLLPFISDQSLALILPVVVYWAYSLLLHWLSTKEFPWLEKYRIHDKEDEMRNKVSLPEVVRAVIMQQLLQTVLGFLVVITNHSEVAFDDELAQSRYQQWMASLLSPVLNETTIQLMAYIAYQYIESSARFFVAMAVLDTWQYFLHRLFHVVPFLYKHFHSRHHRLYVNCPMGALYNHPFEGFMMDSLGASIAFLISGMGNRGALVFFSISTLKTVDDHCGYNLPFNPLQQLFSNNADYHDIHHQIFGLKSNFSQPFGTFWDHVLGTYMSREKANEIIARSKQRKATRMATRVAPADFEGRATQYEQEEGGTTTLSRTRFVDSVNNKHEDRHLGGNDNGNDNHDDQALLVEKIQRGATSVNHPGSSADELRKRMATRAQIENGVVSGKGQGKAL